MKIFEVAGASKNELISNIVGILSITDDERLFQFVEKQLGETMAQQEAIASKDARIKAIYAALSEEQDTTMLDFIESKLKQVELENRVEKLWAARGFNSGRMIKYKDVFKNLIIQTGGSLKSKIQFLFMVTSNKSAIQGSAFAQSFSGNIDTIVPDKIRNNDIYRNIRDTIFFNDSFRGKGIGPGEFALALLGKGGQIVDHKGDVIIDGVGVEIKGGEGGSIKTGSPNSFRGADKLRDWIGKQVGVQLDRQNKLYWEKPTAFSEAFMALDSGKRLDIATEYVRGLYPNLDSGDQAFLAQGLAKAAGTPEVKVYFGKALLHSYQMQDEWDCILYIGKNGNMTNIASPEDAGMLDYALAGINRDGDTQALPDGYVNGRLRKGKK